MALNVSCRFCLVVFLVIGVAVRPTSGTRASQIVTQQSIQSEPDVKAAFHLALRQCIEQIRQGITRQATQVCPVLLKELNRLPDSDPEKGRALFSVADYYLRSEDQKQEGIRTLERMLTVDEIALGADHWQILGDLQTLAVHYRFANRVAEAEKMHRRAVEIADNADEMNCMFRVMAFTNAAGFYEEQKNYTEAAKLLRRGLELASGVGPGQKFLYLNARAQLAVVLRKQGRPEDAAHLLSEPMPPRVAADVPGSPARKMAQSSNLYNDFLQAREYKEQGDVANAELYYRQVISATDGLAADARPWFLDTALEDLAAICQSDRRDAEAEQFLLKALQVREVQVMANDPKMNPDMASRLSFPDALENFYRERHRLDEMEPIYQRALKIQEQYYGPTSDWVRSTLLRLGSLYEEERKFAEALSATQKAVELTEKRFGREDPQVLPALDQYARALEGLGRQDEANRIWTSRIQQAQK